MYARHFLNNTLRRSKVKTPLFNLSRGFFSFDQFLERPKRHFFVSYKFNVTGSKKEVEVNLNDKHSNFYKEREKLIKEYERKGQLILGGNGSDCTYIVFQGDDETVPDSFIKNDPLYKLGLIEEYEIKELELISTKKYDEIMLYYKYR